MEKLRKRRGKGERGGGRGEEGEEERPWRSRRSRNPGRSTGEESWLEPERLPTDHEKKKVHAMAVIAGAISCMDNHIYRFTRQTRKQKD